MMDQQWVWWSLLKKFDHATIQRFIHGIIHNNLRMKKRERQLLSHKIKSRIKKAFLILMMMPRLKICRSKEISWVIVELPTEIILLHSQPLRALDKCLNAIMERMQTLQRLLKMLIKTRYTLPECHAFHSLLSNKKFRQEINSPLPLLLLIVPGRSERKTQESNLTIIENL